MNRKFLFIITFFINFIIYHSETVDPIDTECRKYGESTGECRIIENTCQKTYSQCSDITGTNSNTICPNAHIRDKKNSLCVFDSSCKQTLKNCSELDICETINDDQAIPNQRVCRKKKDNCVEVKQCSSTSKEECTKTISNTNFYNCVLTGEVCGDKTDLKCNDYVGGGQEVCNSLASEDTNKKCIYDKENDDCIESYTSCEVNGVELDQEKCTRIKPWISESDKIVDTNTECIWRQTASGSRRLNTSPNYECVSKPIIWNECKDYSTFYDGGDKNTCENIIKTKDPYKKCVFDNTQANAEKCKSVPKQCSEYDLTSIIKTCESINPPPFTHTYDYSNGNCILKIKEVDASQENSPQKSNEETTQPASESHNIKGKYILVFLCLLFL